jgi:hypothetical protein
MQRPARNFLALITALALSLQPLSSGAAVPSMSIGQNFTGSTLFVNSQAIPPDSNGVIGPRHFVEFINGSFTVYNKTNGASVKRIADTKFWSNAGVILATSDAVTDPRVIYDPLSQRWFASMVDFDANASSDPTLEANDFLLAVSATSDPTGVWKGFLFQADPDNGYFADFPTLGVDSNGVYMSGDFYQGEDNPLGAGLVSFPKADLLLATPTIANRTWFGVMSYDDRGEVLQPANCFDGSTSGKILSASDIGTDSDPHSNIAGGQRAERAQEKAGCRRSVLKFPQERENDYRDDADRDDLAVQISFRPFLHGRGDLAHSLVSGRKASDHANEDKSGQ